MTGTSRASLRIRIFPLTKVRETNVTAVIVCVKPKKNNSVMKESMVNPPAPNSEDPACKPNNTIGRKVQAVIMESVMPFHEDNPSFRQ